MASALLHNTQIKICGIQDAATLRATVAAGADFIGFVHFPKSIRHVPLALLAELVAVTAEQGAQSVIVLVNPDDTLLQTIFTLCKPDYIQLHGDETPARVQAIKEQYPAKIIKAISVISAEDIQCAKDYAPIADMLLFDTKAPTGMYGGTGHAFDWSLLRGFDAGATPWMLSGGLDAGNVARGVEQTGAPMVDVSSHVETPVKSGQKDIHKVVAFIQALRP